MFGEAPRLSFSAPTRMAEGGASLRVELDNAGDDLPGGRFALDRAAEPVVVGVSDAAD